MFCICMLPLKAAVDVSKLCRWSAGVEEMGVGGSLCTTLDCYPFTNESVTLSNFLSINTTYKLLNVQLANMLLMEKE